MEKIYKSAIKDTIEKVEVLQKIVDSTVCNVMESNCQIKELNMEMFDLGNFEMKVESLMENINSLS